MPKAGEIAKELRRLADALDKEPETELKKATVYFLQSYGDTAKEMFLSVARLMPRPYDKKFEDREIRIGYDTEALSVFATVNRNEVCTIVKPAVYDCVPLLTREEEAEIEATHAD